jgi:hypothetical protein
MPAGSAGLNVSPAIRLIFAVKLNLPQAILFWSSLEPLTNQEPLAANLFKLKLFTGLIMFSALTWQKLVNLARLSQSSRGIF